MKRLAGMLLFIAMALSVLLAAGAVYLWLQSYHTACGITRIRPDQTVLLSSEQGRIGLTVIETHRSTPAPPAAFDKPGWSYMSAPSDPQAIKGYQGSGFWGALGFGATSYSRPVGSDPAVLHVEMYWLPHWVAVLAMGLVPAWWSISKTRSRLERRTQLL